MRVTVDLDLCSGHGRCYGLAPEVFSSDPDGYSVAKTAELVPPELEERARMGERNCPERAITISD